MLTRKRAAVLFSFKRIYSILSCVKQAVGADDANFLGEFTEKAARSNFIGWTVGGNRTRIFQILALAPWENPIGIATNNKINVCNTSHQYLCPWSFMQF